MYEFLIRDCDEKGFPKIEKCAKCKKTIPSTQLNLHNRRCAKNKGRSQYA